MLVVSLNCGNGQDFLVLEAIETVKRVSGVEVEIAPARGRSRGSPQTRNRHGRRSTGARFDNPSWAPPARSER